MRKISQKERRKRAYAAANGQRPAQPRRHEVPPRCSMRVSYKVGDQQLEGSVSTLGNVEL